MASARSIVRQGVGINTAFNVTITSINHNSSVMSNHYNDNYHADKPNNNIRQGVLTSKNPMGSDTMTSTFSGSSISSTFPLITFMMDDIWFASTSCCAASAIRASRQQQQQKQ